MFLGEMTTRSGKQNCGTLKVSISCGKPTTLLLSFPTSHTIGDIGWVRFECILTMKECLSSPAASKHSLRGLAKRYPAQQSLGAALGSWLSIKLVPGSADLPVP